MTEFGTVTQVGRNIAQGQPRPNPGEWVPASQKNWDPHMRAHSMIIRKQQANYAWR